MFPFHILMFDVTEADETHKDEYILLGRDTESTYKHVYTYISFC